LSPESYLATRLDVLQSIGSDREPWASGEHVLRTMRTLFAVKRSIADRQVVSLLPEVQPR
jgi:hypothetical protein